MAAGADKEAGGRLGPLVGQQLDIREAAVIVDADIDVLVAGASLEAAATATEQTVARPVKASSFFTSTWTSSPGR